MQNLRVCTSARACKQQTPSQDTPTRHTCQRTSYPRPGPTLHSTFGLTAYATSSAVQGEFAAAPPGELSPRLPVAVGEEDVRCSRRLLSSEFIPQWAQSLPEARQHVEGGTGG
jgi:hypothetical protein